MPQDERKRARPSVRVGKVDVGTTASRVGGGMGKPKSAAQKLLETGSLRQKYEAYRVLAKSKTKKSHS